ncbi:MFAP4-like protein [Mya arenaria]|uniref:MFAP4-like protein n=1 Tax=Mya arenaria TaxID=6604 RepID=A0ABY7G784_MYAAR|nr:MFAP4-like protein [Mya arenaria]
MANGLDGVHDQTCDQGTQRRSRLCSNPPPSGGGRNCTGTYIGTQTCLLRNCLTYSDCSEIHKAHPDLPFSIYLITTWNTSNQAKVVCDMDTDGGGWTSEKNPIGFQVFQHRFNGSVDFYRNFSSYEDGFGFCDGEFWLGLSPMHEMMSQTTNELRIDIERANGTLAYVVYPEFMIDASPT